MRRNDDAEAGATGDGLEVRPQSVPRGSEGEIPGPDRGDVAEGIRPQNIPMSVPMYVPRGWKGKYQGQYNE